MADHLRSMADGEEEPIKPVYRQWWLWVGLVIVVGVIIVGLWLVFQTGGIQPTQTSSQTSLTQSTPTLSDDVMTAQRVESYLKQSYGLSDDQAWVAFCQKGGFDYEPYPCAITAIEFRSGVLRITVEETLSHDDAKTYASYALNFLCATKDSTAEFRPIIWVEIVDASRGTPGQAAASSNSFCQRNG
jgi:hypothetical protein